MSGLQEFIRQRRQDSYDELSGNDTRNAVTATTRMPTKSQTLTTGTKHRFTGGHQSAPRNPRRYVPDGQGDVFDTDAESLDDTTVTTYTHEQPWDSGHLDDLDQKDPDQKIEGQSFEESEEDDTEESEEETHRDSTKNIAQASNISDRPQPHQQVMLKLKGDKWCRTTIQSSNRNNEPRFGEATSPTSAQPLPLTAQDPKFDTGALYTQLKRPTKDQQRLNAITEKAQLLKFSPTDHIPFKVRTEENPPTSSRQTVQANNHVSQFPLVQSSEWQRQESLSMETPDQMTPISNNEHDRARINKLAEVSDEEDGNKAESLREPGNEKTRFGMGQTILANECPKSNVDVNFHGGKPPASIISSNKTSEKRRRDLDYSLDDLAVMRFQQLNDEPFHTDPHAMDVDLPAHLACSTLEAKLDYLQSLKLYDGRNLQQQTFFNSLPIEEYEECGDIIVERFCHLVERFKTARRERRKAAKEFEEEVARREECVRESIHGFEKDFDRLKRSGEDVVKKRLAL